MLLLATMFNGKTIKFPVGLKTNMVYSQILGSIFIIPN